MKFIALRFCVAFSTSFCVRRSLSPREFVAIFRYSFSKGAELVTGSFVKVEPGRRIWGVGPARMPGFRTATG